MNQVIMVGRITDDPSLTYTQSGKAYVRFSLAVDKEFTVQEGDETADFIPCVVWNKQAENLAQYVKKGRMLGVAGSWQTSRYEDQNGNKRTGHELVARSIEYLSSPNRNNEDTQSTQGPGAYKQPQVQPQAQPQMQPQAQPQVQYQGQPQVQPQGYPQQMPQQGQPQAYPQAPQPMPQQMPQQGQVANQGGYMQMPF